MTPLQVKYAIDSIFTSGFTVGGSGIILPGNPTNPLGAVPKQYVDDSISGVKFKILYDSDFNITQQTQTIFSIPITDYNIIIMTYRFTPPSSGASSGFTFTIVPDISPNIGIPVSSIPEGLVWNGNIVLIKCTDQNYSFNYTASNELAAQTTFISNKLTMRVDGIIYSYGVAHAKVIAI